MRDGLAQTENRLSDGPSGFALRNPAVRLFGVLLVAIGVSACGSTSHKSTPAEINNKTKFTSKEFGVSASKRVTTSKKVKKGGGTYKIGKPYKIRGKWYHPKEEKGYDKKGMASWYGPNFHGRKTANGEIFDQYHLSGAHPTFPLPSYARVTNLSNGHSVVIRVNDRGPYSRGRIIDVSSKAADLLEMKRHGTAKVRVQYLGPARMDGRDMPYLTASYKRNGKPHRLEQEERTTTPGVMLALTKPKRVIDSVFGSGTKTASTVTVGSVPKTSVSGSSAKKGGRIVADSQPAFIEETPFLPQIGPVPRERPTLVRKLAGELDTAGIKPAAYARMRIEQQSSSPFDAVLAPSSKELTETMIAASWKRRSR